MCTYYVPGLEFVLSRHCRISHSPGLFNRVCPLAQLQNQLREVKWPKAPGTTCDRGRIPVCRLSGFKVHALRYRTALTPSEIKAPY